MQRKYSRPKCGKSSSSQSQAARQNCPEEILKFENQHCGSIQPVGRLQRNPDGSQPTESKEDAEARNDLWSIGIRRRVRKCADRRIIPNTTEVYFVTRATHTNLDVMQEKRINDFSECWWGLNFVRFGDRIQETHVIERDTSSRVHVVSGERLTKIWATARPDFCWPAREEEQSYRQATRSTMQENWEGNISSIRKTKSTKKLSNTQERNSTFLWKRLFSERWRQESVFFFFGATGNSSEWRHSPTQENHVCLYCGSSRIYKEAFVVYSSEISWRPHRRESIKFSYSLQFGGKNVIPMRPAIENPDAKAAVKKWMREAREDPSMADGWCEAQKEKRKVPIATLMDICHLKNAELEPKHQKIHRTTRVPRRHGKRWICCTRGFTDQGSSASQTTAAKDMFIARWPGCAGQAADAVSAHIQVKMEGAPYLSKFPVWMSRCMDTSSAA